MLLGFVFFMLCCVEFFFALCCVVLRWVVLCCAMLSCAVLHWVVLCYAVLCCAALCCVVLSCHTKLQCSVAPYSNHSSAALCWMIWYMTKSGGLALLTVSKYNEGMSELGRPGDSSIAATAFTCVPSGTFHSWGTLTLQAVNTAASEDRI